ncbi:choice-of-anchor G family protein [Leucobacter iarius]|uniref:Cell wall binding repeat protein n=1 Tax=Leucobacter iarius TaxID=333963 RepID=A0ABN2LC54_9MICO
MTKQLRRTDAGKRRVRGIALVTAAATILAPAFGVASAANADSKTSGPISTAASAAHGHGLWVDALNLNVLGGAEANSYYSDSVGPNRDALNVSLLGALKVDLGNVKVPLLKDPANPGAGGLLDLGSLGAISSYGASPTSTKSVAASGLITQDGALNLDASSASDYKPAKLDVSALLEQVLGQTVTDTVLDQASVNIGALASHAESNYGQNSSEYMLAGLGVDVHSNLVGGLVTTLGNTLDSTIKPVSDLAGPGGLLETTVKGVTDAISALGLGLLVSAKTEALSVDVSSVISTATTELLKTPLQNSDGSITVDLKTGLVHVDLAKVLIKGHGVNSLNELPANTEVLDADTVNAILAGVTDALTGPGANSLTSKAVNLVTDGLYNAKVNVSIEISALGGLLAKAPVTVSGSIGDFLFGAAGGYKDPVIDTSQLTLLGSGLLGQILTPVTNLLKGLVQAIGNTVLKPVVTTVVGNLASTVGGVTTPVVNGLLGGSGALKLVLQQLLALRINEQPTKLSPAQNGDLGSGSFTVRPLSLTLLPTLLGNDAVKLQLGSSTVKAAADPKLTATPSSVEQGATVTLKGDGFTPTETVSIAPGAGTPVTATTGNDGTFTKTWAVPANQALGSLEFTATGGTSNKVAKATVTVTKGTSGANANTNANANAGANANASASAAASAQADSNANAAAQAAAQAAAKTDATTTATAAATANADSAAKAAADPAASTNASTTATTTANAAASASAKAAANTDASSNTKADASAAATANAEAASKAAATANSSTNASANAAASATSSSSSNANSQANTNATASASASANANSTSHANAQAAAKAAAMADNSSQASAAANGDASIAAKAAANQNATATTNATSNTAAAANAAAQVAAAATADSNANSAAHASASTRGNANAGAASQAAAQSTSSSDASADADGPVNNTKWKRLGGADRFKTAVKISQETFPKGSQSVVIARSDIAPDALSAAPFAAKLKSPVLLTQTKSLNTDTAAELKRLKPKTAYIAGQTGAVSTATENAIKALGIKTVRLGGGDRYETSLKIAEAGWGASGTDSVFVATGRDYPDALSAGSAAGAIGAPVLLVDGMQPVASRAALAELKQFHLKNIYIAGGEGVVSKGVATSVRSSATTVKRYAGLDRYETSALLAAKWNTKNGLVYLATGLDFPDALSGSAVAGAQTAPIMLTQRYCIPKDVYGVFTDIKPKTGFVLGGTGVVSDKVLNNRPSC